MRQGQSQQNKNRARGRGGRSKGGNQSSRNMESNGPDVRIRGTAAHIAEKYGTLARDAHSAGDLVAAENYYQHAEHYNRLIALAQASQNAQRDASRNENPRQTAAGDNENAQPQRKGEAGNAGASKAEANSNGPQPTFDQVPAEVAMKQMSVNGGGGDENQQKGDAASPDADSVESPPRKRRVQRKPRKEAKPPAVAAGSEAADDAGQELPAFIVGASDS